jgi:hypothetical protein
MSINDVEAASRRVQAMRTRLDDVLSEFRAGEPVAPEAYQRSMNDLCKALLELEEVKS